MEDRSATALFASYLDAKDRGENPDFDALCEEHPSQADVLRTMSRAHFQMESALGAATVREDQAGGDDSRWREYLEKLSKLGPPIGRYARGAELNSGGMGAIHRVADPLLDRRLVVKLMHADASAGDAAHGPTPRSDDKSLGRFLEEAKITARLDHPYIVPVHDIGLDEAGHVYFAMKHVRGEDLRAIFDRIHSADANWSMTKGVQVMLKVCEAMAYAHVKGVIHRDLKPGNVMVGKFGEVYVMDWGLARILGEADTKNLRIREDTFANVMQSERHAKHSAQGPLPDSPLITMDGDVMGTPAYMPLEQAEGNLAAIGPRSDIYAVGAMLYHLLAGTMPYAEKGEAVSQRVIWQRVRARPPRPLHELASQAPAELLAIVEKAMARDARDRYPDMKAIAADLQAYLDVRVVSAYETGAFAELKKWVQRNPALPAAAGLLVLVLAGATAIVSQQKREVETKNVEISTQKAAVESQKQLADAKIREFDQLAGKVYLERAIQREKDLHPPWPERVEVMERWLAEDSKRLLDLKPTLEQTLTDLRARALPLSDEEQERDRTTHSKFAELASLRQRLEWLRTAILVRTSGASPQIPSLPADLETKAALELNEFAWQRVDPDFSKRLFGEEGVALDAARRAVAKIETGDATSELASTLGTLAWACFANGLDAQARAASARALESATDDKKAEYRVYSENLEKAIAAHSGEAGAELLSDLEMQIAGLEVVVNARRTFNFALESETFLYTTLSDLAASIAAFESGAKAEVEQRLVWAKQIGDLTLRHPNARVTWETARAAIAKADGIVASKSYASTPGGPIDLKPQTGLVPIGMNPVTKLWEFYELRSACDVAAGQDPSSLEIPTHREDGSIEVKEGTGIVFVLLPGGTFLQGAQKSNESAPNYDPRAVSDERPKEVTLSPFFLARHELTRAQWYRLSKGEEPSANTRSSSYPKDPPIGWTHPVESVDWTMCRDLFARQGLTLPTEARWEYGARGGTTTVWWTGHDAGSLGGAANVLDTRAAKAFPVWGSQQGDFDDGFIGTCPVGSMSANPFGLVDVHGNVWEWCLDAYANRYGPARSGDGLRAVDATMASPRVLRGGSYGRPAAVARSAIRNWDAPTIRSANLGARPARSIAIGE